MLMIVTMDIYDYSGSLAMTFITIYYIEKHHVSRSVVQI